MESCSPSSRRTSTSPRGRCRCAIRSSEADSANQKGGKARTLPLTRDVTEVLKSSRKGARDAFLFPSKDGKLSRHQGHADRPLKGALKRAGLRPIRFHDLRHSFASQLASGGRSLKEVQEVLGHESTAVTMRYAHLAPGRMREAVAVLDGDVRDVSGAKNLEQTLEQNEKSQVLSNPARCPNLRFSE